MKLKLIEALLVALLVLAIAGFIAHVVWLFTIVVLLAIGVYALRMLF